jgi:hypothetical protein
MGLFFPEDASYDESVRMTGFNRYKQLLSFHAMNWMKVNLLTVAGALPLAAGITLSVLSSSILMLIPASIVGGMIFGGFLSGLYDSILRGLRDDPNNWWTNYKKSWKQNWKCSLVPGAILGLIVGMFVFMGCLLWWSQVFPGWGTIALYAFSALLFLLIVTLYWPQLVLFDQSAINRMRNIILFTSKYLWKVLGVTLLQMAYIAIYLLFAPWTLLLMPFIGFWFIVFLSQFFLYDKLDEELHIEELYFPERMTEEPSEDEEDED